MRLQYCTFLVLSFFYFSVFGQQTDCEKYGFKGKVKSVEITQIEHYYDHLNDTSIYKYSDTTLIETFEFLEDGKLIGTYPKFNHDFSYNIDLDEKEYVYDYDSINRILSKKKEVEETGEFNYQYYKFNESNKIIQDSSYRKWRSELEDGNYLYHKGSMINLFEYNVKGFVEYYFFKSSFVFGIVDHWSYKYEYDEKGNWTKRITYPMPSSLYPIGTPNQPIYVMTRSHIRKIEYYE